MRGQIKGRISINKRPKVMDDKARVGDWEIDTVIGKGHRGALVTVVGACDEFCLSSTGR